MYIQTKLLYSCVKDENEILAEFIEKCGDKLLENGFIFKSAKGGNFALQRKIDGFDTSRYEYDQNMYSHIFNGFFPTYDLLKVLEEKEIIVLKDLEKKIYTLGYLLHDIDKIWGKELKIDTKENIEIFKTELFGYYLKLGADSFLPEIKDYIGDLAFLIVNTQKSRGTNLDQRNFSTKLNDRSLVFIRKLCTYSDKITYLIKSPSDILDSSINKEVEDITEGNFKLFFHKLPEVRGLISNVINNALIKIYEEENFIPYLFFSDGVVYIGKTNQIEPKLDIDNVFEKVKKSLGKLCGNSIKKNAPGFKFTNLSTTKNPQYYFDFVNVEEYLHIVSYKATNPSGTDPSLKMVEHFKKLAHDNYKKFVYQPDERIGGIGRFLIFIEDYIYQNVKDKENLFKIIFEVLEIDKYKTEFLELRDCIQASGSYGKVSGGAKIEYFYLANKFIEEHKGITFNQDENFSIEFYLNKLISKIIELYNDELSNNPIFKGVYLNILKQYIEDLNITKNTDIFLNELDRYTNSKKMKKSESVCSICSSSYPTNIQEDSSVPFQSSTFKNKILTFKGGESGTGSICSICSIEFMLRQILISKTKLSGSGFSDMKAKYFYVYPNYFFTNSTQKFVRKILEKSKNVNIFDFKRDFVKLIQEDKLNISFFLNSEEYLLESEINDKDTSFLKIEFPERENMNLVMTAMKGGDSDTESWTIPTLLAFFYFIMLNSKVVLTDSLIPLYNSQYEIKESIIFDSPHNSIQNILKKQSLNIDEIYNSLVKLMTCYSIHIDTYSDGGKPNWNQFNEISRGINTDLFEIFRFMKKNKTDLFENDAKTYLKYLDILGGNKEMSIIKNTVQRYAVFYSAKGWSSYGITRPVSVITNMLLKTDPETLAMEDDMKLFLTGELMKWTGSVIGRTAKGYILIRGKELNDCLNDFTEYFYDEIFKKYCKSDISLLRSRLNGFLGGCEAYYVANYKIEQSEEEDENA